MILNFFADYEQICIILSHYIFNTTQFFLKAQQTNFFVEHTHTKTNFLGSVYILELEINVGFFGELCGLLLDNSIQNVQNSGPEYTGSSISSVN